MRTSITRPKSGRGAYELRMSKLDGWTDAKADLVNRFANAMPAGSYRHTRNDAHNAMVERIKNLLTEMEARGRHGRRGRVQIGLLSAAQMIVCNACNSC